MVERPKHGLGLLPVFTKQEAVVFQNQAEKEQLFSGVSHFPWVLVGPLKAGGVTAASVQTFQGNGIIKKLQGEVRGLLGKIKVKNSVTVSQERLLKDAADRLQAAEKELESTQKQLLTQQEQVCCTHTCDSPVALG